MNTRNAHRFSEPRPLRGLIRIAAAAALLVAVLAPSLAHAAVYDPLNIISYETWRARSSMSVADIQAFLDAQTGPLKSYVCTDTITGSTPVRRTAATIIWRSAQAWNVNPKVILATLQKEQSLLTMSNSANAARLVKAMGCGVYGDANHDGKTDNRYPGFANQIYNGARVFSTYEVTYHWSTNPARTVTAYKTVTATKTVDGQVVSYDTRVSYSKKIRPLNASTFALYVYTPYYPQKGFWDIYTRYFEDPLSPPRLRPMYRFRNTSNGTYYYTASEAKRYTLIRTASKKWSFSGVSFTVDTSATANTFPLFQLYNTRTHRYTYTAYTSTRDRLIAVRPKQWRYDGAVARVSHDSSGTAPVFRLENKKTHSSILTASVQAKTSLTTGRSATFTYKGVAFYLDALVTTTTPVGPGN